MIYNSAHILITCCYVIALASSSVYGWSVNVRPNKESSALRPLTRLNYGESTDNDLQYLAALTQTETWLTKAVPDNMLRKEVSYVCESGSDTSAVVSGIWKRLSQVREQGEAYAEKAKKASIASDSGGAPAPYRSTLVVVCPGCTSLEDFKLFDNVVQTINESRRHARSFVVEDVADKMREAAIDELPKSDDLEWSTSVNLAHLHPEFDDHMGIPETAEDFASLTPEEQEAAREAAAKEEAARSRMTDEERALKDENNRKVKAYREKKTRARRSPHPTVVIEVRTAVQNWGEDATNMMATPEQREQLEKMKQAKGEPNVDHLKNLEASFLKSATMKTPSVDKKPAVEEDTTATEGLDESEIARITLNPRLKVEQWFNDKKEAEGFTKVKEFSGKDVDEAFGYLFNCMSKEIVAINAEKREGPTSLVFAMPRFLKSSATSFTKFAEDVEKIIDSMRTIDVKAECFHDEIVDEEKRAPTGVIVFTLGN